MASPKKVMAEIFSRFVDKPGHNMLASEVVKKLDAAGYAVVPKVPTDAMQWAGGSALHDEGEDSIGIYKAMIAEASR